MSRFHSYISTAVEILDGYNGQIPFAGFIKDFFRQHKKFGATDRRIISHICYCYFRLGKAVTALAKEERLLIAFFLCADQPGPLLAELKPGWNDHVSSSLSEKISITKQSITARDIFPWVDELTDNADVEAFAFSHLQQPDLFLRVRPGKQQTVEQKLIQHKIAFESIPPHTLAIPNSTKLDDVIILNRDAVVQDLNSQRTGLLLQVVGDNNQQQPLLVWDCCAASGGKSIMAKDMLGEIELTVSDVRSSIIANLRRRFAEAGINNYDAVVADLSKDGHSSVFGKFGLVIADVPCSGSGTWARTPEQLYYFQSENIDRYAKLQRTILSNITGHVADGGYLLYITCSVFKKENEEAVNFMTSNSDLQLVQMELLKGYDKKADTLFVALLQRRS